jgi:outer membrane protein
MSLSLTLRSCATAVLLLAMSLPVQAQSIVGALTSAYVNSPSLMSALLSVKSAAENIVLAKAGTRPAIGLSLDGSASVAVVSGVDGWNQGQSMSVNLSYRQTVFDSFQTDSRVEQARAMVEVSTYALANEEQNVLLSVVQAYVAVVRDQALVRLRQENLEFFDAQVASAEDRLRIGEGTRIDISQAEARRAQAVAAYRSAIADLTLSQASFERWVGMKPRNLTLEFPYARLLPKTIDRAIELASSRHPAILTARAAIRAAQAGSDEARAAFGPTLDLIGSICAINCAGGGSSIGMSGSVRLTLAVPLYAGGALGASVRKANLEQIKSEVDALDTRDQIREAVVSAWTSLQNATAQIESAQSAVESGQLVLEGIIQERDVGQRTTLDVLNAQAELTQAREGQIQANAGRIIASFALIAATGGLNAPNLGLNVEIKSASGYVATVEDIWQELRAIDE